MNLDVFDTDREEVIDRAREAGIDRILIPGIDIPSSRSAIALAEQYQEIYAAIGVHPNSSLSWNKNSLAELEILADNSKVVAIGEIGLDYYRDHAPHQLQIEVFRNQLELSARKKLPVVIHNRNAAEDIYSILHLWYSNLKNFGDPLSNHPGVLHSFSGDEGSARLAISENFMIGITGPVTFKNDKVVQKTVVSVPLDTLLIETDAPYLTPHPFRGSRNEPARVRLVADKIAQLRGMTIEIVAEQTSANADRLFNWRDTG